MKNILMLQTGGTIAMNITRGDENPDVNKFTTLLHKEMPELTSIANVDIEQIFFEDSSDINPRHWIELSNRIHHHYPNYDGFVILHGTDTMAYTASALSFSLNNVGKPVIFTGSQVPMSNIRSDAHRNVINAVELATQPVYDVAICFNDRLYRGNRSTKMSIGDFDAFASPNFPVLAEIGIDINLLIQQEKPSADLKCNPVFDNSLHVIKIYPGLNPEMLNGLDLEKIDAVIFETFGSGNFPVEGGSSLLPFMETCQSNSCQVIITSQAPYDSVDLNLYKSGRAAKRIGALGAGDMTIEATVTKTMYLLGCGLADDEFKSQFEQNVAGERSQ